MPKGQIIRALSSFYYVRSEDKVIECKARGLFKKNKQSPLVGDFVTFNIVNDIQGYITEIEARKNELRRPPISNVEQAVLVFSVKEPELSILLLDKFIIHIEKADITPIICLSKTDLLNDESTQLMESQTEKYQNVGYTVIQTSKYGKGIAELKATLQGKTSVFAGQSGVGKSTLLNSLLPDLNLETAAISQRLGRGKHTTRAVQLVELPEGGKVADTPGFSQLDFKGIESVTLDDLFAEFREYLNQCRFRRCQHTNEPGCMVRSAVEENKINKDRYQHYLMFLEEIKKIEENKWR